MNKVILIGNLGNDPEVRTLENGTKVASFSIATSERWKNKQGEKQEETDWHNCVVWSPKAEVVESYLKKGSKVMIEGKIKTRQYEKDGEKKYITEIKVDNFEFLDSKPHE
jgi:single-strand DNA-binding protein